MKSVARGPLDGEVSAPPSKSMMIRAVAAGLLAPGLTRIEHPSGSDDARAALGVARALGARIEPDGEGLLVSGGLAPREELLDCFESGLCLRLFAAVSALAPQTLTLTGHGSLLSRPLGMVVEPLRTLGARCETLGTVPVTIEGPLRGGRARVDGRESSQFLSGLLMALPLCPDDSELEIHALKSTPYVRMTCELLGVFGIRIELEGAVPRWIRIPGRQSYRTGLTYQVEGDWSGAAGLLVAGALAGRVSVTGLRLDSPQADRAVLQVLANAGARLEASPRAVRVERADLRAFNFDATDCPDLIPVLSALALACPGQSVIAGAGRLRHKESDRAAALLEELGALGGRIALDGDRLLVEGGPLHEGEIDPRGDHRIAMAGALAAIAGGTLVHIQEPDTVNKSYPGFFEDLRALGAEVS